MSVLFADDIGLASERVEKLQEVFNKWKNILENHGLRVSESKTEYMFLPFSDPQAPTPDVMINGNVMPKCNSFKYIGSIINKSGSCDEDVNHRISVALLKWRQNSRVKYIQQLYDQRSCIAQNAGPCTKSLAKI